VTEKHASGHEQDLRSSLSQVRVTEAWQHVGRGNSIHDDLAGRAFLGSAITPDTSIEPALEPVQLFERIG
jgi:hypothetical protein